MVAQFDYGPIRQTALDLIKRFGRKLPVNLLRATEATPADPAKPWRVGDGTVTTFPFIGVYAALGFPKTRDPVVDATECDIIMPGDVNTDSVGNVLTVPIEPVLLDRIQIMGSLNGATDPIFAILGVQRIDPDGTPICFKLRCRVWSTIIQPGSPGL